MRIVFVTTKLNFITSGASVEELDLKIRRFQQLGHEVLAVTMFRGLNNIPELLPYKVMEEHSGSGSQLALQYHCYRVLKKYAPLADVFYVDGQVFLYGAGLYRLLLGKPVCAHFNRELTSWPELVSSHFGMPRRSELARLKQFIRFYLEKFFFIPFANRIDACSFTNPHLRETYRNFGFNPKISLITGDAFDYKRFMHKYDVREDSYRTRNKHAPPYTIYYSSRMAAGKGFDTLIEAFSKLRNKNDFRLILGGAGPDEQKIKERIVELGIGELVSFTGWAPKVEHYTRLKEGADMLVQPSQSGFDKTSYILLEAMAMGVPSILPRGGGLEWDARESAIYFMAGDTDDLARKIEELGSNRELRATLSQKCYERLKEGEMDYHTQVGLWEEVLKRIVP